MRLKKIKVRLSIRLLLILVAVFGIWLGWRVDKAEKQRRAVAQIKAYNGYVCYDFEYDGDDLKYGTENPTPKWIRQWFGDEYFQSVRAIRYLDQPPSDALLLPLELLPDVEEVEFLSRGHHTLPAVEVPNETEQLSAIGARQLGSVRKLRLLRIEADPRGPADLRAMTGAKHLEELDIWSSSLPDECIPALDSFPQLRKLRLWQSNLTGDCLIGLEDSPKLESLDLMSNHVTSASLTVVGTLTGLHELNLSRTSIDDAGLAHLSRLTNLEILRLNVTKITDAGLIHLQELPRLRRLDLTGCNGVTAQGLANYPHLERLISGDGSRKAIDNLLSPVMRPL
jgi:Leucine Rich repeats (2 copies)/Leucine Rich repeat